MKRRTWLPVLAAGSFLAIVGLVALEAVLRRVGTPSPERLLARLRAAWDETERYQAQVSVGLAAGRGPLTARQWYARGGPLFLSSRDITGSPHLERWDRGEWLYYQPDAAVEARVSLSGAAEVPYARWMVSGFPSLADLVEAITGARDHRVTGSGQWARGRFWLLECAPGLPATAGDAAGPSMRAVFRQRLFSRRWKVWLDDATGLPFHVVSGDPGSDPPPVRLTIDNLDRQPAAIPADWRKLMNLDGTVRHRLSLACDLRSEDAIRAAQQAIHEKVDAEKRRAFLRRSGGRPPD